MIIVISLLFPARFCWDINNNNITLVFIIAFAIFAGYCFLFGNSVISILKKKTVLSLGYIKDSIFIFLKSYLLTLLYLALINYLILLASNVGVVFNVWVIRMIFILIVWCVNHYPIFKKSFIIILLMMFLLVVSINNKVLLISLNLEDYVLVLFLLLCQIVIKTSIYETIHISKLKKGMILSMFSSMLMQSSTLKGLPKLSSENLNSRLTEHEVESVKQWALKANVEQLTIVKKIPFAIFISCGVLMYLSMWGVWL